MKVCSKGPVGLRTFSYFTSDETLQCLSLILQSFVWYRRMYGGPLGLRTHFHTRYLRLLREILTAYPGLPGRPRLHVSGIGGNSFAILHVLHVHIIYILLHWNTCFTRARVFLPTRFAAHLQVSTDVAPRTLVENCGHIWHCPLEPFFSKYRFAAWVCKTELSTLKTQKWVYIALKTKYKSLPVFYPTQFAAHLQVSTDVSPTDVLLECAGQWVHTGGIPDPGSLM